LKFDKKIARIRGFIHKTTANLFDSIKYGRPAVQFAHALRLTFAHGQSNACRTDPERFSHHSAHSLWGEFS
jgi:hypothetical protein